MLLLTVQLSRRQRSLLSQPKVRDFWELDVAELFEQDSLLKNKIAHFLIKVDAAFGKYFSNSPLGMYTYM